MRRFTTKSLIVLAATLMLGTVSALAADLSVKVHSSGQGVAITNHLATQVIVLYMVGDDNRNYDVQAKLEKGATVAARLHNGIPARFLHAVCAMKNPPPSHQAEANGSYRLSVLME